MLNNGYIRCGYCGKLVEEDEAVTHVIHSIKMYGRGGKKKKYCSGECAGKDQMAHEG